MEPATGLGGWGLRVAFVPSSNHIHRDLTTMAIYGLFSAWGWFIFGYSASIDLVATDLGVSKGQAGLTMSAIAVGSVIAGFASAALTARWGRRNTLVLAGALLAAGVLLVVLGQHIVVVGAGAFFTGLGGPMMLTTANPALLEHHGPTGPAAVTEANAAATAFGMLAPFVTSLAVGAGLSWRHGIGIGAILAAGSGLLVMRVRTAGAMDARRHAVSVNLGSTSFPFAYWIFWAVSIATIGLESSTTAWAPTVMIERLGMDPGRATGVVSLLIGGMLAGRLIFGRLSVRGNVGMLLTASFGIGFLGWLGFWLATSETMAAVFLFVAGVGYGVNFPFMMVMAIRAAGSRPDTATGFITVAQGIGGATISPALGFIIDRVGAHKAFTVVGAIALSGVVLSAIGTRLVARERAAQPPEPAP